MKGVEQRIGWIDFAKGLGIFLVLLGHWYYDVFPLRSFIYSFHMPLFFILSGVLFAEKTSGRTFREVLLRQIKAYAIPYIFFVCITAVFCLVFSSKTFLLDSNFWKSILLGHPIINGPLWFLYALALAELGVYCVLKWPVAILSSIGVGILFFHFIGLRVPGFLYAVGGGAFLGVGIVLKPLLLRNYSMKFIFVVFLISLTVVVGVICIFSPPITYMAINLYPSPVFFAVTGIVGTIGCVAVSRLAELALPILIVRGLEYVGVNSLFYFSLDRALLPMWQAVFPRLNCMTGVVGLFIHIALISVLIWPCKRSLMSLRVLLFERLTNK